MEIKAVINEKYEEMELHVCNSEMNDSVQKMVGSLNQYLNNNFVAKKENGDTILVYEKDIVSVYAENQKVYVRVGGKSFETAMKLYEFEEKLNESSFMRISRAEIVNTKKIKRLDLGITGTIKVIMSDGYECYTSRRNVTKLKKALGI